MPLVVAAAMASLGSAALRAEGSIDWSKAQSLTVLLIDDKFVPDKLTFRHNVPYALHLENRGKELHEFTAPEFFAASLVRESRVLANGGQDVVVQPGASVEVYLMPMKPGHYRLICADHDWAGMVGRIVVE